MIICKYTRQGTWHLFCRPLLSKLEKAEPCQTRHSQSLFAGSGRALSTFTRSIFEWLFLPWWRWVSFNVSYYSFPPNAHILLFRIIFDWFSSNGSVQLGTLFLFLTKINVHQIPLLPLHLILIEYLFIFFVKSFWWLLHRCKELQKVVLAGNKRLKGQVYITFLIRFQVHLANCL